MFPTFSHCLFPLIKINQRVGAWVAHSQEKVRNCLRVSINYITLHWDCAHFIVLCFLFPHQEKTAFCLGKRSAWLGTKVNRTWPCSHKEIKNKFQISLVLPNVLENSQRIKLSSVELGDISVFWVFILMLQLFF